MYLMSVVTSKINFVFKIDIYSHFLDLEQKNLMEIFFQESKKNKINF